MSDDRRWIASLELTERQRTGIRTLKVGHNKVFGYYLEVTRPYLSQVPTVYQRKQTLVSAERFVTPDLQERETRILRGEERFQQLEQELFSRLQQQIAEDGERLRELALHLAELDVATALAELACARGYCRPTLDESGDLELLDARHPVVESTLEPGAFIPNDCRLGPDHCQAMLVTGPNMAGKSTYLRQVAQIVLLAQIGSFVPCRVARIGLVDRIFTRVGAQDDIAGGASTFMVEMMETASILRHATERSLVVLDEIGRGTSTFDGLAIAEAVVRETHDVLRARTLFATHFHELARLEDELPRLRVFNASVSEEGNEVVFLRRIVLGAASRSYGVQVARLAGLPTRVTERATRILEGLEARRDHPTPLGSPRDGTEDLSGVPGYDQALSAATRLFELTADFPETELAGLTSSLRSAARLVCTAVVAARHAEDVILGQARRAVRARADETLVWIDLACRCGYLSGDDYRELTSTYAAIAKMAAVPSAEDSGAGL
jgi:DNA mismatch repair protein MutS